MFEGSYDLTCEVGLVGLAMVFDLTVAVLVDLVVLAVTGLSDSSKNADSGSESGSSSESLLLELTDFVDSVYSDSAALGSDSDSTSSAPEYTLSLSLYIMSNAFRN